MNESDVQTYNQVALGVNASIYAYYAGRIVDATGVVQGRCLDVGCGGGYLGLALSELTELEFVFLDKSPEMLRCAAENIQSRGICSRCRTIQGEVQSIPLDDASVDLVVSRGSVPFWDNLPTAFNEIRRILKPGGHAYIGGGLGPPELREALQDAAMKQHPEWRQKSSSIPKHDNSHYREALLGAGIERFTVTRSEVGMWIEFRGNEELSPANAPTAAASAITV